MTISPEMFEGFKVLMREKVGEEKFSQISEQELLNSAISLLNLVEAVYQPLKSINSGQQGGVRSQEK